MELLSLIAACALGGTAPETLHGLVRHQSQGEPATLVVEGEAERYLDLASAAEAAVARLNAGETVRVGLAGVKVVPGEMTPFNVKALLAPCVNVVTAERRLQRHAVACGNAAAPERCALARYLSDDGTANVAAADETRTLIELGRSAAAPRIVPAFAAADEDAPAPVASGDVVRRPNADEPPPDGLFFYNTFPDEGGASTDGSGGRRAPATETETVVPETGALVEPFFIYNRFAPRDGIEGTPAPLAPADLFADAPTPPRDDPSR